MILLNTLCDIESTKPKQRGHIGYTFVQGSAISCKIEGLSWEKFGKRPEMKSPETAVIGVFRGFWGVELSGVEPLTS